MSELTLMKTNLGLAEEQLNTGSGILTGAAVSTSGTRSESNLLSRDGGSFLPGVGRLVLTVFVVLIMAGPLSLSAFPPAPHHVLYGTVKTQFGDPVTFSPSDVYLETPSGVQLKAGIQPGSIQPGVNYRLEVPMDSGTSSETNAYHPTALKPFFPFRLKVLIGNTPYLPIEMAGDFASIGEPGEKTRIDLTLGVDSDGDGLPDAWEEILISIYGGTLSDIKPEDDTDGDGIPNIDEYLAGTYAFDPSDGFKLSIVEVVEGHSRLEFMTVPGRTYTIQSSRNLGQWSTEGFRIMTGDVAGPVQDYHKSVDVQNVRVEVPYEEGATNRYFRAIVQ